METPQKFRATKTSKEGYWNKGDSVYVLSYDIRNLNEGMHGYYKIKTFGSQEGAQHYIRDKDFEPLVSDGTLQRRSMTEKQKELADEWVGKKRVYA